VKITRTISGEDPSCPIYGDMQIIETGEVCEFDSYSESIFNLKMKDGRILPFHRRELDFAD